MKSLTASTLLVAAAALLFGAKETPPAGGPPKPFHLPVTEEFVLPNGMKVSLAPYGAVPKVAVRAFVDAGALYEPAGQVWIAKLTALLLKEGTATRPAAVVAREAADMGGQLEVDPGSEFMTVGGVVLSDFGPKFIALVGDVLQHAALPESELPRIKTDLGRELAVDRTVAGSQARARFLETLFPNHPYGHVYPSDQALAGYTADNVRAFYRANFNAARTHLYVAGKLDAGLRHAIRDAFSSWEKGTAPADMPSSPVKSRSLEVIDRPGAAQSTLYIGLPVADPTSADYVTLGVMDSMLGGSFASRITANIRERKGYTYSPYSQVGTRKHLAYWVEMADVTTAVTGPALTEIFSEIDRIRKEPPPLQELTGIQNYLAGLFVIRNTLSADALINQMHFVDAQGLDRSYLSTYVQKVMAVKPADIQRVAETYVVPSKMTIVVVGDRAKIADQLKPFQAAEP